MPKVTSENTISVLKFQEDMPQAQSCHDGYNLPPGNEEGMAEGKLAVAPPGILGVASDTTGVAKFGFEVRA